jgi:netrin receptor unc-5
MQVERRLGGCLLEKPKQMLFQFGGANLCLSIEDFGLGWRCKQAANYQVSFTFGALQVYLHIV